MKKGIVLVEVLIAVGILGMLLVPIMDFFVTSLETNWFAAKEIQAQALLQEEFEAVRLIRERDWNELINGSYYPTLNAGRWELVASETGEVIDMYTRKITVGSVYRDQADNIVPAGSPGARLDPSTKEIVAMVNWHVLRDRSISATAYLTRYLDNLTWIQTSKAEFDQGEFDLTKTEDPPLDNGEVILEGGCFSGTPESLIYDDQLRNGWRVNCDGLTFWRWLLCRLIQFFNNASINVSATDYTWNGSARSMKITLEPPGSGSFWSWARIYNYNGVCTRGFENIHFYVYNPGDNQVVFNLTAVYDHWDNIEVVVPAKEWTEVSIDYEQANEGYESSLTSIYFSKWISAGEPAVIVYIDQLELTGGLGGYFTEGTFSSSVFDAGQYTAFNRLSFTADILAQTELGFQVATSDNQAGPWLFYGPGGTTDTHDLYTDPTGGGIWLGNNLGRYLRYRAYLRSLDGENSPILREVTINYSP